LMPSQFISGKFSRICLWINILWNFKNILV
jgi:hypothetical protein